VEKTHPPTVTRVAELITLSVNCPLQYTVQKSRLRVYWGLCVPNTHEGATFERVISSCHSQGWSPSRRWVLYKHL